MKHYYRSIDLIIAFVILIAAIPFLLLYKLKQKLEGSE